MAGFSDWLENDIIEHYLRTGTVYLALHLADPTDADLSNEVVTGNYARQVITFAAATTVGTTKSASNDIDVNFPAASIAYPSNVTYWSVRDALTGGHALWTGSFNIPKPVGVGDRFRALIGMITCSND